VRALPRLTLAESFERYHIDESIDDGRDREVWQDEAAKDVMGGTNG
jgi:hypothetical protein